MENGEMKTILDQYLQVLWCKDAELEQHTQKNIKTQEN